mgnify:CR=1 FL=1
MKKIIIFGCGENSRDIIEMVEQINNNQSEKYELVGLLDDNVAMLGKKVEGVKVIGNISNAKNYGDCYFVNGIYPLGNFSKNREIIENLNLKDERFITLIHPSAYVSKTSKIGHGSVVFQNSVIMSNATIGSHVNIQPNCIIHHRVFIGDFSFIANSVSTGGLVRIDKAVFIGMNCTIKEKVIIGSFSVIGMGSTVISDVPSNSVFVGAPARFLRKSQ